MTKVTPGRIVTSPQTLPSTLYVRNVTIMGPATLNQPLLVLTILQDARLTNMELNVTYVVSLKTVVEEAITSVTR